MWSWWFWHGMWSGVFSREVTITGVVIEPPLRLGDYYANFMLMKKILCRKCHSEKDVIRHYRKTYNDRVYEYFLCQTCLKQKNKRYHTKKTLHSLSIDFTYSAPFQFSLDKEKEVSYPAQQIEEMQDFWDKNQKDILRTLKDITGLSFKEQVLKCYLNYQFSVSDPFCLQVEDIKDMQDNLIHELIHILMTENRFGLTPSWKSLMETYKDEHPSVRVHIAVHRIHYLVTQALFPERLNRIMSYSTKPRYVKAWKIAIEQAEKVDQLLHLNG